MGGVAPRGSAATGRAKVPEAGCGARALAVSADRTAQRPRAGDARTNAGGLTQPFACAIACIDAAGAVSGAVRLRDRLDRLKARRALRRSLTPAEATLWKLLRRRAIDGRRFRRQASVGAHVLDFFCPAESLAIEPDGAPHDHDAAAAKDRARDDVLAAHGIRTLRFENRLVFEKPEAVVAAIRAAFEERG